MFFGLLLFSCLSWADSSYPIPEDSRTISEISSLAASPASLAPLANSFELLVWNVHKGAARDAWARDMKALSSSADVVFLQEGMQDAFMPDALAKTEHAFWMAKSFEYSATKAATGVISGFKNAIARMWFRRSPGREPILNTPKMSLLSILPLTNGRRLLMINIHAINFVGNDAFKEQILDLMNEIRAFDGPVIFAGDFNTWNPGRSRFLKKTLAAIGMNEVIPAGALGARLDYIFERGCPGSEARSLKEVNSSDHAPIRARMNCG